MKTNCLTAVQVLLVGVCMAQERTVASGIEATGSGGTMSATVGLIDYQQLSGTTGELTLGVQQPYEFWSVSLEEVFVNWSATIFPNPFKEDFSIEIPSDKVGVSYQIFDINGRIIMENVLSTPSTAIHFDVAPASYILQINDNGQTVQRFKLIKSH